MDMTPSLVIIESPYKGEDWSQTEENIRYARNCVRDSLNRGEAPIASHLLFTQEGILDDKNQAERMMGINAGHAWMIAADLIAVYVDRGISSGMQVGINRAKRLMTRVEFRSLAGAPIDEVDY